MIVVNLLTSVGPRQATITFDGTPKALVLRCKITADQDFYIVGYVLTCGQLRVEKLLSDTVYVKQGDEGVLNWELEF